MISVIVPTMWKPEHMNRMLPMLDQHELIGEIIIIDNDQSKTNKKLLDGLSKLVYWSYGQNVYVNPAWNRGAKLAKYDKLFFLNDDCLINIKELDKIYDAITPDKGIIGFSKLSYCTYTIDAFDSLVESGFGDDLYFEMIDPREHPTHSGMPHISYGSAMFMHKNNYHPIPEDFRIYYGDLYIYLMNLKNNVHNYIIENGLVMTYISSTVNSPSIGKDILLHEATILKEKFAEYGLRGIKYSIPKV